MILVTNITSHILFRAQQLTSLFLDCKIKDVRYYKIHQYSFRHKTQTENTSSKSSEFSTELSNFCLVCPNQKLFIIFKNCSSITILI